LDTLRAFWRKDPTSRRLEGRAAAYDRRFAAFVVRAAKELPPEAPGASLEAPGIPDWGGRFFAVYHFAPTPLLLSPDRVSPGWWTLKYPAPDVPSDLVQGSFDGGVLLRPAP
jgi:hypothetical protein